MGEPVRAIPFPEPDAPKRPRSWRQLDLATDLDLALLLDPDRCGQCPRNPTPETYCDFHRGCWIAEDATRRDVANIEAVASEAEHRGPDTSTELDRVSDYLAEAVTFAGGDPSAPEWAHLRRRGR